MEKNEQTCSLCHKKVIPSVDGENHCSVEITHHYGSPKDGDILLYDVCIQCVETLFGEAIALKKRSIWDNWGQEEGSNIKEENEDEKTSLAETEEYKMALEEFNKITDRAICIFIYNEGSSLSERIKVLDLEEGQIEEYKGEGKIIIACFNEEVKVEIKDWLEWAMEIAREWHLEEEVKSCYDRHIAEGYSEEQSANMALYDWDI